ncbi:hypothetical protein [Kamptonema formosum]
MIHFANLPIAIAPTGENNSTVWLYALPPKKNFTILDDNNTVHFRRLRREQLN